ALGNPVVSQVISQIEQANPEFNLAQTLAGMKEASGIDASEVDNVLVVFDQEHLEMLPFMAMLFMGGGLGGPTGAFDDEMHFQEFSEEEFNFEAIPEDFDDFDFDEPLEDSSSFDDEFEEIPATNGSCDDEFPSDDEFSFDD